MIIGRERVAQEIVDGRGQAVLSFIPGKLRDDIAIVVVLVPG